MKQLQGLDKTVSQIPTIKSAPSLLHRPTTPLLRDLPLLAVPLVLAGVAVSGVGPTASAGTPGASPTTTTIPPLPPATATPGVTRVAEVTKPVQISVDFVDFSRDTRQRGPKDTLEE